MLQYLGLRMKRIKQSKGVECGVQKWETDLFSVLKGTAPQQISVDYLTTQQMTNNRGDNKH